MSILPNASLSTKGAPGRPVMTKTIMTRKEAATYLCTSESTLDRLRGSGGGPAYSQARRGTSVTYHVDDLDKWQRRNRRESTSSHELKEAS